MPGYDPLRGSDNDGRFPDESVVAVRFPTQTGQDRAAWPWLPGVVLSQCGPDEWRVLVDVPELACLEDGSPPPPDTPEDKLAFPVCFRGSAELAAVTVPAAVLAAGSLWPTPDEYWREMRQAAAEAGRVLSAGE